MIINRKIKRTMMESKSQYLGSVILIIISCLLYTMFNLLSSNMNDMVTSFEKNYVMEDASFATGTKLSNIQELESRFNVRIEEGAVFDYSVSKDKTLRIFRQNSKVNIPAIIEGSNLKENEILVDPAFANANKLKIGNYMQIFDKTFRIAGYMSIPNYIYPLKTENDIINDPNSFGIIVLGKNDFNKFNRGNNFYSIKFNESNGSIEAQALKFKDYLKSNNIVLTQWTDIGDNKRVTFVSTKIQGISKVSSSAPVAILLLTSILTGIVIWRMLKRESVIIGTLYAQGYKRREIKKHYLLYPLIIALTGGITGTILGALLLKPMLNFMLSYFNMPIGSINFNVRYMVTSLLLPVFFLGLSGYFVLNKELKYSPVELMRGGGEKGRVNFIERKLKLDMLKFRAKFQIREQLRSLSRLVFLMLGVVLATMLLLYGFTAKSSLDYFMKDTVRNSFKFQYEYVYKSLHEEMPSSNTESFSVSVFTLKSDSKTGFEIVGINPASKYISLKSKNGTVLNTDKVIITRPLADKLKINPGSTVQVIEKLSSKEYSVTIENVAESYIGEYIFMPVSQFNNMMGLPVNSYIGLWSNTKLDIPEKLLYSSRTVEDSLKALNTMTQPIQSTIGVMAFMSFIIGLIVIYVVTSLIIEENRVNISLMKVFGYRRREIDSLILDSPLIVVVIGYIMGIPLIMSSMSMLFKSLTESVKLTMPVTISYPYIAIGFIVVYLTYEFSKVLSSKKVDRIAMSEALKSGVE